MAGSFREVHHRDSAPHFSISNEMSSSRVFGSSSGPQTRRYFTGTWPPCIRLSSSSCRIASSIVMRAPECHEPTDFGFVEVRRLLRVFLFPVQ